MTYDLRDPDWRLEMKMDTENTAVDRSAHTVELICGGCDESDLILFDERTDRPWAGELEPCGKCGASDWCEL